MEKTILMLLAIIIALSIGLATTSTILVYNAVNNNSSIIITSQASLGELQASFYYDITTTVLVNEINWGTLEPGQVLTLTVYLKNEGTIPFIASMYTENWYPTEADSYVTINWDNNQTAFIYPNRIRKIGITIQISPDVVYSGIHSFSNLIHVDLSDAIVMQSPVITNISITPNPVLVGTDVTCEVTVLSPEPYNITWYVTDITGTWAMGTVNPWVHAFPDTNERVIYAVVANSYGEATSEQVTLTFS